MQLFFFAVKWRSYNIGYSLSSTLLTYSHCFNVDNNDYFHELFLLLLYHLTAVSTYLQFYLTYLLFTRPTFYFICFFFRSTRLLKVFRSLPFSQLTSGLFGLPSVYVLPEKAFWHEQLKSAWSGVHVPLFLQGSSKQASSSGSNWHTYKILIVLLSIFILK